VTPEQEQAAKKQQMAMEFIATHVTRLLFRGFILGFLGW